MKHGNSSSAKKADAGPTSSISLGMAVKPPALPRRDDVLVNKGAEAPKLCLSPVEMRTITVADGLLSAGIASTAMRAIFSRQLFSWNLSKETEKKPSHKLRLACPSLLEEDYSNEIKAQTGV